MKNVIITIFVILAIGLAATAYILYPDDTEYNVGSIVTGQSYYATSTPWDAAQTDGEIKGGWGSLAQVAVTSAGDLKFCLYDAISTDVTHFSELGRSTSTQQLTCISTATVGTYTFDAQLIYGLYLDVTEGTTGTTTVTYR